MKTIRILAAITLFLWVIAPLLILAAIFCDHDEQTRIGDALAEIARAIGGGPQLSRSHNPPTGLN